MFGRESVIDRDQAAATFKAQRAAKSVVRIQGAHNPAPAVGINHHGLVGTAVIHAQTYLPIV